MYQRINRFLYLSFFVCAFESSAVAQEVCGRLADNIRLDRIIQGDIETRFNEFQNIIRDQRYSEFTSASQSRLDANMSISGYVDGVLGRQSDSSTWGANRQDFLNRRWAVGSFSRDSVSMIERTSESAVRAVVDCARVSAERARQGFFGVLASVSDRRDQFTIQLERVQRGGALQPVDIRSIGPQGFGLRCDDDWHTATPSAPRSYNGLSLLLNYSKESGIAMDVTVVTSAGDVGPFRVVSLTDDVAEMRRFVAAAENAARNAIPRGTISFFNLQGCPDGWRAFTDARGRYLVGVPQGGNLGSLVGEALTDRENRATGAHSHISVASGVPRFDPMMTGRGGFAGGDGISGSNPPFPTGGALQDQAVGPNAGLRGRDVPGTNAPYVQLLTCEKT